MPLMRQREYARHRAEIGLSGTTHRAVQKAIERGRIAKNADGLIDSEAADQAWASNTSEGHIRNAGETAAGRSKASPAAVNDAARAPSDAPPHVVPRAATAPTGSITLSQASAIEKGYRAKLAKLDLEEREGKLVPAAEVRSAWAQIVTISRNKVRGLPSQIKERIPALTVEQIKVIGELVDATLEDLANGVS